MSLTASWSAARHDSACSIRSGSAEWSADIDHEAGGSGLKPSPHDLLDSALAACTALTLQLYARRRGYALEGVDVDVAREEGPASYRLQRRIRLSGPLDAAARAELMRVAEKCPIHKALGKQFTIETEAAAAG